MNFLEKLNYLMEKNHLNKSTLSKACNIPYTTIDGWYKKGYEGLKLTTLRKLADFFGTSLDYWAAENNESATAKSTLDIEQQTLLDLYNELSPALQEYLIKTAKDLLNAQEKLCRPQTCPD